VTQIVDLPGKSVVVHVIFSVSCPLKGDDVPNFPESVTMTVESESATPTVSDKKRLDKIATKATTTNLTGTILLLVLVLVVNLVFSFRGLFLSLFRWFVSFS